MNLCNDGHEEVCYEGRECPVCDITNHKNREIEDLEHKIAELEHSVSELEAEVQAQKDEF